MKIHSSHKALMFFTLLSAVGWTAITACSSADEGHDHGAGAAHGAVADEATQTEARVGDSYPLATCVVSGESLDAMGGAVTHMHEGREIKFCCNSCLEKFMADPANWLKKLDAAIVEQQSGNYAMETCPVTGKQLGSMGEPVNVVVGNRLVRLCCAGCEKALRADPAKYLEKLDAAVVEKQRESYPLKTCVVSGEVLGSQGKIKEHVFAGRLVRLCCPSCVSDFEKNPQEYLKKLDAGNSVPSSTDAAPSQTGEPGGSHEGHMEHAH